MAHRLVLLPLTVLLQIIVPGFLLWGGVDAYQGGVHGRFATALIVIGSAWLVSGLGLLVMRSRPRVARWIPDANLVSFSAVFCLVLLEVGVSMIVPICRSGITRIPRPPGLWHEVRHNSVAIPGRLIDTVYSTNEFGLRGSPFVASRGAYKVLAVGGSTTENSSLDDTMAWPFLLQGHIETDRGGKAWVQNAGVSGHTSVHHVLTIRGSPLTASADLILILAGVNDVTAMLAFEGRSSEAVLVRRSEEAFGLFPLYSRSAVFKLLKLLTLSAEMKYDVPDVFYRKMREKYRASSIVPLPPLEVGVQEYGERIRRIAAECKRQGKRCVLMTQPTIWRSDLDAAEAGSLWLGRIGPIDHPRGYASAVDLRAAMDRFNGEMIRVAHAEGVEVYDLAANVPRTRIMFHDDCHFTNAGSEMVASKIAGYLRESVKH